MKYKVGDKVKCIGTPQGCHYTNGVCGCGCVFIGLEGRITKIRKIDTDKILFHVTFYRTIQGFDRCSAFDEQSLELFKRIIKVFPIVAFMKKEII